MAGKYSSSVYLGPQTLLRVDDHQALMSASGGLGAVSGAQRRTQGGEDRALPPALPLEETVIETELSVLTSHLREAQLSSFSG